MGQEQLTQISLFGFIPDKELRTFIEKGIGSTSSDPYLINFRQAMINALILKYASQISRRPDIEYVRRAMKCLKSFLDSGNLDVISKAYDYLNNIPESREKEAMLLKLMDYSDKLLNAHIKLSTMGIMISSRDVEDRFSRIIEILREELEPATFRKIMDRIRGILEAGDEAGADSG